MRLSFAHQLAALIVAAVTAALAAVSVALALSLFGGFEAHVREREALRLSQFADHLSTLASRGTDLEALRGDRHGMRDLMDGYLRARGEVVPPMAWREAGAEPPHGAARDDFPLRVQIVDRSGNLLGGRHQAGELLSHPVLVHGVEVESARLALPAAAQAIDDAFAWRQFKVLGMSTALVLAVTLTAALLIARAWRKPLVDLQTLTARIAAGDLEAVAHAPSRTLEIDELSRNVVTMAATLKTLDDSRKALLARLSHELRGPLTVLQAEIESVEDDVRVFDRRLAQKLGAEVRQAGRILDDFQHVARRRPGEPEIHREEVDALAVLDEITRRLLRRSSLRSLSPSIDGPTEPRLTALWDIQRIEQILGNLLRNSDLHTRRPGRLRVSWSVAPTSDAVELCVEDSAPGMTAAEIAHFLGAAPSNGSDAPRATRPEDSPLPERGLGLGIVRSIARAHGGRVSATGSRLGGTRLCVVLPLVPEKAVVA